MSTTLPAPSSLIEFQQMFPNVDRCTVDMFQPDKHPTVFEERLCYLRSEERQRVLLGGVRRAVLDQLKAHALKMNDSAATVSAPVVSHDLTTAVLLLMKLRLVEAALED